MQKLEITLPIATLKQAVAGLGKVMSRSSLPVLRTVRLRRNAQGEVTLQATDLDNVVIYRASDRQSGPAGEMLVPWEALTRLVKTARDRISFEPETEDQLVLRTYLNSIAFEEPVGTISPKEWPVLPEGTGPEIVLDQQFKQSFQEALSCVSRDSSRPVLNGVCLDLSYNEGHYLVGCDGRRLYAANSFQFQLPQSVLIPDRKFVGWTGFMEDGDWKLRLLCPGKPHDPTWIEIESERWTFRGRMFDGPYPNWRQVIPHETAQITTLRFSPEAAEFLLQSLPQMPTNTSGNQPVTLRVRNGQFLIAGRAHNEAPRTELPVGSVGIDGPDVVVTLNRNYLVHALRIGLRELELRDELTALVFRDEKRRMIIMPLREEDTEPATPTQTEEPTQPSAPAEASAEEEPTSTERNTETMTAPTQTNGLSSDRSRTRIESETAEENAIKAAISRIETIRGSLKETLQELAQMAALLKTAEKEQKASEKEIESVRSTLRSLQKVQL